MAHGARNYIGESNHDLAIKRCTDGHGYAVHDGRNGRQIGSVFREKALAERYRDKLAGKADISTRLCMACQNPFSSRGIGHRRCDKCKKSEFDWP